MATTNRMHWIDWMKVLGMYFIVYSHFYSVGCKFVCEFHVALFFIVSGILCQRTDSPHLFWKKLWYNFALPMLIMCTINFVVSCILSWKQGTLTPDSIPRYFIYLLSGTFAAVQAFWFVYTLMVIKIIWQFLRSKTILTLLVPVFLSLAYIYHNADFTEHPQLKYPNAIVNVCTAYPFFYLGTWLKRYITVLDRFQNRPALCLLFIVGAALVYVCGISNGDVQMYRADYGTNIILFLMGGIGGTTMVYAFSKLIGKETDAITTLSVGTLVILGFHPYLIAIARTISATYSWLDLLYTVGIMVVFVPIIKLAQRYCPTLLGRMRIR